MVALNDRIAAQTSGNHEDVVLFLHGGAGPELTWSRQAPLADRWRLVIPWRRCFDPSPPGARQDWEVDARDLVDILPQGAHVVAHSYGGVGAAVAVAQEPHLFASLTLIEPPLWFAAEQDPEVVRFVHLARAAGDPNADPELRKRFLQLAGLPAGHPDTLRIERLARDLRDPGEARPDLAAIRSARVPTAVVSGDHSAGMERICDALREGLGGERIVLRGAGHAVQRTPEFNGWLASFLENATRLRQAPPESDESSIVAFLRARGADAMEHPGGTLLAHLVRVARRLESWDAPAPWIAAGLCHAAYGTDGFPTALLDRDRRRELAHLIGAEAETIVYTYGCCDRRQGLPLSDPHGEMHDRFTGTSFRPHARILRAVIELTCANEIDVLTHSPALRDAAGHEIAALLLRCRALASRAAGAAIDEAIRSLV